MQYGMCASIYYVPPYVNTLQFGCKKKREETIDCIFFCKFLVTAVFIFMLSLLLFFWHDWVFQMFLYRIVPQFTIYLLLIECISLCMCVCCRPTGYFLQIDSSSPFLSLFPFSFSLCHLMCKFLFCQLILELQEKKKTTQNCNCPIIIVLCNLLWKVNIFRKIEKFYEAYEIISYGRRAHSFLLRVYLKIKRQHCRHTNVKINGYWIYVTFDWHSHYLCVWHWLTGRNYLNSIDIIYYSTVQYSAHTSNIFNSVIHSTHDRNWETIVVSFIYSCHSLIVCFPFRRCCWFFFTHKKFSFSLHWNEVIVQHML